MPYTRSVLYDERWENEVKIILTDAYRTGYDIVWHPSEVSKITDYQKGKSRNLVDLARYTSLSSRGDIGLEFHNESTGEIIYNPEHVNKLIVLIKDDEVYDIRINT